MRSNHVFRSFTIIAALSSAAVLATIPASAITIASPTEGRIVRDKVRIVVPRYSLPSDISTSRFITIKVDGRFLAAIDTSMVQDGRTPASPNIVYVWDTKATINDPLLSEEQRHYKDGRHEIVVEAHSLGANKKDVLAETAKVVVNLQNKIPRPNPAPPLKLRYRYHLGQQSTYRVSVSGEILDSNGYSLTAGQVPITAAFDVGQSVEDVEGDGSALIRYKVDKNSAYTQVFGQMSLLGQVQRFPSVYKIIDDIGRTVDANVFSGRRKIEVTDCLVRLPGHPAQIGDTWPADYRMKLEGLSDVTVYTGTSTLDDLEWEGGLQCAKITTKLSGEPTFSFFPQSGGAKIAAANTAYFAYKLGKLVKDVTIIEYNTTMDSTTLASIQQQMFPATTGTGMPGPGMPGGAMPGAPPSSSLGARGAMSRVGGPIGDGGGPSGYGVPTAPSSSTATTMPAVRSVRIRFVVTKELKR